MSQVVLDSSALVALIRSEAGADMVEPLLPETIMSAVNVAEVVKVLQRKGFSYDEATLSVSTLVGEISPYSRNEAYQSASFEEISKRYGLSLGDCACLALSKERSLPALTADKAWKEAANHISADVRLIR